MLSSLARKAAGAIEHRHSLRPLFSGVTDDASLGHFVPRECGRLSIVIANGSRECAPDDRLREAIHAAACGTMDCFVASLLAMTTLFDSLIGIATSPSFRGAAKRRARNP